MNMISSWIVKGKFSLKLMCLLVVFTTLLMSLSFLKQARNGCLRFEMVNGILNWTVIRIKWTLDMNSFITLTSQCCVFVYWSKCCKENRFVYYEKRSWWLYNVYRTETTTPHPPMQVFCKTGKSIHPPTLSSKRFALIILVVNGQN